MKATEEQLDALRDYASSDLARLNLQILDDIVETIKGNVLSVPLDKDPEKAANQLLVERMKYEGSLALRNAFNQKLKDLRSRR
jgi:hypothetical protein